MYTMDFYTLVKAVKVICSLVRKQAGGAKCSGRFSS